MLRESMETKKGANNNTIANIVMKKTHRRP